MIGHAKNHSPNFQYSLRLSQIRKRQPSAKKSRNTLVHCVEPGNPLSLGDVDLTADESNNSPLLFYCVRLGGL